MNMQDMERECAKVAGIEKVEDDDAPDCVQFGRTFASPKQVEQTANLTGAELVEKLKAWLNERTSRTVKKFTELLREAYTKRTKRHTPISQWGWEVYWAPEDFFHAFHATFVEKLKANKSADSIQ